MLDTYNFTILTDYYLENKNINITQKFQHKVGNVFCVKKKLFPFEELLQFIFVRNYRKCTAQRYSRGLGKVNVDYYKMAHLNAVFSGLKE